ncbi:Gfo/Idh/MocA family protein [Marinobacterium aestuariivivens]|uniref:Gfo/Idh/MocA family protein n=1 Tax=Marinobacterium aestuariivivens TaxID=1698799 RepID=A0ABW2A7M5_9GAMM
MRDQNIGLIGAGAIGQTHISTLDCLPGFRLAAIADPGPATAAIAESSQASWFAAYRDMLEKCELDGVIVATPNELHVDVCIDCLERGCRYCWKSRSPTRWPTPCAWLRPASGSVYRYWWAITGVTIR